MRDMWNYNVCDMAGTFLWREAAWTKVRDGKPIFDPDIVPVSTAFEQIVHNACQIAVTDTGWGQTIPSNILCWTGAPLVRNGSLIRDFRKLSFTGLTPSSTGCNQAWTEVVYAGKWRDIACPRTYNTRTKANGDLECWKLPPECTERASVGNPITLLDGCKSQREVDYRSRTPGGLEVERHYNSAGYFRFDVAPEKAGDVWRTTWDRRILVAARGRQRPRLRAACRRLAAGVRCRRAGAAQQPGRGVRAAPAPDRCRRRGDRMAAHHREQRRRDL